MSFSFFVARSTLSDSYCTSSVTHKSESPMAVLSTKKPIVISAKKLTTGFIAGHVNTTDSEARWAIN